MLNLLVKLKRINLFEHSVVKVSLSPLSSQEVGKSFQPMGLFDTAKPCDLCFSCQNMHREGKGTGGIMKNPTRKVHCNKTKDSTKAIVLFSTQLHNYTFYFHCLCPCEGIVCQQCFKLQEIVTGLKSEKIAFSDLQRIHWNKAK